MQIYNTENSESTTYHLNTDLRMREPGDDDDIVQAFPYRWSPSDLSFNPETFTEKPACPGQLAFNYLDNNAHEGGGWKEEEKQEVTEAEIRSGIAGELARSNICLKTAAHFDGSESGDLYHHVLNCRKPWCEICGGKKGVISKTRKKAVRSRIDVKKYGMMQFVFTTPMEIRPNLQSREKLNSLTEDAKQVIAKHFGDPLKTKRKSNGEVKEYSFGNELSIGYLHLFGDPDKRGVYREGTAGTFNPHPNVHVFKDCESIYLTNEKLEEVKQDWKIRLVKYGYNPIDQKGNEKKIDVHYRYVKQSAKDRKKYHKIKYMVKPYLQENIARVIEDDNLELLKLLTIDMKGFRFLRFWGGLSNVKKQYREDAGIYPDDIDEIEQRMQEKLIFRSVTNWNLNSFLEADDEREKNGKQRKFKRIAENFYRETLGGNDAG